MYKSNARYPARRLPLDTIRPFAPDFCAADASRPFDLGAAPWKVASAKSTRVSMFPRLGAFRVFRNLALGLEPQPTSQHTDEALTRGGE